MIHGTPKLRRIDYIREIVHTPMHGTERGNNPYAEAFGILPRDHLLMLLKKYPVAYMGQRKSRDVIRLGEVARACNVNTSDLRTLDGIGNTILRRLTRFLLAAEHGLIVKRNGELVHLETATRKPDHIYRVCFSPDGRPTIARADHSAAPKRMPRLFAGLSKLPGQ